MAATNPGLRDRLGDERCVQPRRRLLRRHHEVHERQPELLLCADEGHAVASVARTHHSGLAEHHRSLALSRRASVLPLHPDYCMRNIHRHRSGPWLVEKYLHQHLLRGPPLQFRRFIQLLHFISSDGDNFCPQSPGGRPPEDTQGSPNSAQLHFHELLKLKQK